MQLRSDMQRWRQGGAHGRKRRQSQQTKKSGGPLQRPFVSQGMRRLTGNTQTPSW